VLRHRLAFASRVSAALWLLALADGADAHAVSKRFGDFYAGALHPLTALEHVLPFLALGILAGQRGAEKTRSVVLAFPAATIAGACLALWLPSLPGIAAVNIVSAVLFGALVAAAWPLPAPVFYGLAVLFGFTHGYANGAAVTDKIAPYLFISGIAVAAAAVLAYGMLFTDFLLQQKPGWLRIAVRVAGSWIAAIGLLVLSISGKALLSA
jgi:urease accessory protein